MKTIRTLMVALMVIGVILMAGGAKALAGDGTPAGKRISHANCTEVLVVEPDAPSGLEGTTVSLAVVGPNGSTNITLYFVGYTGPVAKWAASPPNLGNGVYVFSGVNNSLTATLNCWENDPTEEPTDEPTSEPTIEGTEEPTSEPTIEGTEDPTLEPTEDPTTESTVEPTEDPTDQPTDEPTRNPGDPTPIPTVTSKHDPSDPAATATAVPPDLPTDPEAGAFDLSGIYMLLGGLASFATGGSGLFLSRKK